MGSLLGYSAMGRITNRRVGAGLLLAMLLCGPLGPMGAQHVAHVPLAADTGTGASVVAARASIGHDAQTCAICHLLSGLRWMPAGQLSIVQAEVAELRSAPSTPPVAPLWLGDAPSSRAPPLS